MATQAQPILIIGAGISGLTLAQACRKENIGFRIFERDESPTFRSAGWGLTLNWALPTFRYLLPEDILLRLPETYVNKEAVNAGEKGSFTFFDLSTGEPKWKVPASERIRVSRERLRKLMITGLDIEWSKALTNVVKDDSGVTAFFQDGMSVSGSLLVACDGAHSAVRHMVHPSTNDNYQLPVRLIGAGVRYSETQVAEILKLDPYFLQGSDSRTDAYLWFSFLETPGDPGAPDSNEDGEEMYRCQIMTSWPYREGFFDRADPSDIPNTPIGKLSWMKALSAEWAEPFRSVVQNIPLDAEVKSVEIADWVPQKNAELVYDGRVILLGDALHAMVMYRGEGANHAIVDVSMLLERIRPLIQRSDTGENLNQDFRDAVQSYEAEVTERTELAVLASRQACLDAHDFKRLNDESPLTNRSLDDYLLEALHSAVFSGLVHGQDVVQALLGITEHVRAGKRARDRVLFWSGFAELSTREVLPLKCYCKEYRSFYFYPPDDEIEWIAWLAENQTGMYHWQLESAETFVSEIDIVAANLERLDQVLASEASVQSQEGSQMHWQLFPQLNKVSKANLKRAKQVCSRLQLLAFHPGKQNYITSVAKTIARRTLNLTLLQQAEPSFKRGKASIDLDCTITRAGKKVSLTHRVQSARAKLGMCSS